MKLSSKGSITDNLIVLIVSILLILVFFGLNKNNINNFIEGEEKDIIIEDDHKFDIEKEIEIFNSRYNVISINKINTVLTNILFYDQENNLKSVIINNDDGSYINPIEMFNNEDLELVYNKINELLSLKYAKFIVDAINNSSGEVVYEFKNNEMIIYYNGFIFNPEFNEDILLHVNYNEIDDYLSFKHHLDQDYQNEDGFALNPNKVTVAISFDDGPNQDKTMRILNALEDNKMSATFFMVGNKMNNQKDIITRVLSSHSEIGSHTYSHINMKKSSKEKVKQELNETNKIYKDITGRDIILVRPPYGAYTDEIIKKYNNSFILWNVDTNDWRYKDVDYLVNHILTNIEDGNIILMHDSYDTSVQAVERVLPVLYSKGIQVVSVSTLANLKGVPLEPGKAYGYIK